MSDSRAASYTQPMTGTKQRYADTAPQIIPVRGHTNYQLVFSVHSLAHTRREEWGGTIIFHFLSLFGLCDPPKNTKLQHTDD
jgi:hypothetical protein